jgi:ferric-dicitrate binding protein FerR (iron transport regulator)
MTSAKLDDLALLRTANPVRAEDAVAESERGRGAARAAARHAAEVVDPPRRSRRRSRSVALAGAAAALILAVVLIRLPEGAPSVVDRANAAVSKPRLYHVVWRAPSTPRRSST